MRNRWGLVLILASVVITANFRGNLGIHTDEGVSFEEYAAEVCPDIRQMFYAERQELYSGEFDRCMEKVKSVSQCQSYIQHEVMPQVLRHDAYYLDLLGCGFKL